jgi:glutamyl-tRNA reductase
MSTFLTVGIAHHDAPLAQLEQVAVTSATRARLQEQALAAGCAEVMVLSTCSRVEVHAVLERSVADLAARKARWAVGDRLVGLLVAHCTEPVGRVTVTVGEDAVRHLFRVAAGLDSRIVGETEVQAQLRSAARSADARSGEPHRLRRVVAAALATARQACAEQPRLLRRGLLAERGVDRALDGFGAGQPAEALVVGAGTMGRQVMAALDGRARATLLSRTSSARPGVGPMIHPLEELPSRLASADVVFVATSAGRRILRTDLVRAVVQRRPGRSLTIVDLSLPRNVDPAVDTVPGVSLLDLDALGDTGTSVVPDLWALEAAEEAVHAAAEAYCAGIRSRSAGPTITALRTSVEDAVLEQLRRTSRGLDLPEEALLRMASAVAATVAHTPTVLAREAAADEDEDTLGLLRAAFGLAEPGPGRAVSPDWVA